MRKARDVHKIEMRLRCTIFPNSQDEYETDTFNLQDRDATEMFNFHKLSKPRQDKTFNLQDRDETETFQKTSRDRSVAV